MSEPAKKTDIDIAEYERRVRQGAPRSDDPLAELARLVNAAEPRRREPIDAISPEARATLTPDERDFLNELSRAVDFAQAPSRPSPAKDAEALARAHASINLAAAEAEQAAIAAEQIAAEAEQAAAQAERAAAEAEQAAAEAGSKAAAEAGSKAAAPAASLPRAVAPFEHVSSSIEIPALKAQTALRGGLDLHGLEQMTRLEDIARAEPDEAPEPAPSPKINLAATAFPRATPFNVGATPAALHADLDEPRRGYDQTPARARDLDAALPGDDHFEPAPAIAAAALADQARKPRGRRGMAALVALVGVSVAAGGVALTMKRGPQTANGEPPTIMASSDPVKVAPPAAPAAPADTADNLLARRAGKLDANAKVVGRPEEPVDLAREAQKMVRTVPITGAQDPSVPRTPTGDSANPDRLGSMFPEPRRVRTVSIRPDGTVIGAQTQPAKPVAAAPAPAPAPVVAAPEPVAPSRSALAEEPAAPRVAKPRAATPATQTPATTPTPVKRAERPAPPERTAQDKPVQDKTAPARRVARAAPPAEEAQQSPAEEAAPVEQVRNPFKTLFGGKPQQAAPATTASTNPADDDEEPAARPARADVGSGSYAVQLSSSPSESDARAAASRLGGRFSSELGGRAARIVKGEAGGKTVYRVRVSGMSKEGATSSCASVKSSGGSCFVTHD